MKSNFIIFLFLSIISAPACFGAAVRESVLTVIVPCAASVNTITSSGNNSSINPETGVHNGLEAIFNVKTNGDDSTYDFVLSGSVNTTSGETNGYFLKNGDLYLILANKEYLPDMAALSDITSGSAQNNKNMIAYPVLKNPEFDTSYQKYNGILSCIFKSRGKQNFNISQSIGNTPLAGTYSISDDSSGMYEAAITLNIYRKP